MHSFPLFSMVKITLKFCSSVLIFCQSKESFQVNAEMSFLVIRREVMADSHVLKHISFFNDCNLRDETHHILSLVHNIVNHLVNINFKESDSILIIHSISYKFTCYLTFWGRLMGILRVRFIVTSMEMSWINLIKFVLESFTVLVLFKLNEI